LGATRGLRGAPPLNEKARCVVTFDPTLALKYWDDFASSEMYQTRARASKALEEHAKDLGNEDYHNPDIDDVLDIFEDIGFYVRGDQLTPEVAHQELYYWIRGYYSTARPYLEKNKRADPINGRKYNIFLKSRTKSGTRTKGQGRQVYE